MENEYLALQSSYQQMIDQSDEFEKQASVTGFLASLAAGEAAMHGLATLGKKHNANLLNTGIELGQKGRVMNPYTETLSRNILGNKQLAPYDAGVAIGKRLQGRTPEEQERLLNKTVGMGVARKNRLTAEGQKVKDPVLNALDNYQIGTDRHSPLLNSFLQKGSKPDTESLKVDKAIANAATLPGALVDFRAAARPLMRGVENTPSLQKATDKLLPADTKRKKIYDISRGYID